MPGTSDKNLKSFSPYNTKRARYDNEVVEMNIEKKHNQTQFYYENSYHHTEGWKHENIMS
jgi:hypothetical protein